MKQKEIYKPATAKASGLVAVHDKKPKALSVKLKGAAALQAVLLGAEGDETVRDPTRRPGSHQRVVGTPGELWRLLGAGTGLGVWYPKQTSEQLENSPHTSGNPQLGGGGGWGDDDDVGLLRACDDVGPAEARDKAPKRAAQAEAGSGAESAAGKRLKAAAGGRVPAVAAPKQKLGGRWALKE
jgi:hypothetical protein